MKKVIWEAGGILEGEYPDELYESITETILTAIEKAGMLPPTIEYNTGEQQRIKDTDILHDNDIHFSWEPE